MAYEVYCAAIEKGRGLFEKLQTHLDDAKTEDVVRDDLTLHYQRRIEAENPRNIEQYLHRALINEGADFEDWKVVTVWSLDGNSINAPYLNYISAEGAVVCNFNDKFLDHNEPEDRLEWSEMLFQIYANVTREAGKPLKNLRTIWRIVISNGDTTTILGEATKKGSGTWQRTFLEFKAGTNGFFALLGCPNGKGIVRMLTEHCNGCGRKTIQSVRIPHLKARHMMYFVLEDAPFSIPELPTPSPKKSKGKERRLAAAAEKRRSLGESTSMQSSDDA
jgi:hypothetical protein